MRYVGLDVGWSESSIHVLDGKGKKIYSRRVRGPWQKVLKVLEEIEKPFSICYEASTGYGWLYDRLIKMAERVQVGHPGHLRLIFRSKRKCDKLDAEKLAKLIFLDEVPQVHVPAAEIRSWRAMIEHRTGLINDRSGVKTQMRALLRSHGLRAPRSLWTRKGTAWLQALEFEVGIDAIRRDTFLERLQSLSVLITRVEKELAKVSMAHPGVQLLMSIPGIGIRTAEATMAYIADPHRFHNIKAIGSYLGLTPSMNSSGGKERLGHITKEGPGTVRKMLVEASWQAVRHSPTVKARFERIVNGQPGRRKIALVAVAHYLARTMLAMLKSGETWREQIA